MPDAPKAAPASHSDALTPMDLSVPDSAPQAAPATRSDVLTPMDSSQLVHSANLTLRRPSHPRECRNRLAPQTVGRQRSSPPAPKNPNVRRCHCVR